MIEKLDISGKDVLIRDVRVLDVRDGKVSDPTNVLVTQGTILKFKATESDSFDGSINGEGMTMIPGLIDCHCHILSPFLSEQKGIPGVWALKQAQRNMEATLASGTVYVRDMLSPIKVMNRFRGKIARGQIHGPNIIASGAVLSCKDGYPEFIKPVPFPLNAIAGQPKMNLPTPEKAAAMVRYQHRLGAGVTKVGYTSKMRDLTSMPALSKEIIDAICATSHELGLKVSVHHNWSDDLHKIIESPIDSLEHMVNDRLLEESEVQILKDRGITMVPTLTVGDGMARFEQKLGFLQSQRARELFEEPALEHLIGISSTWLDFNNEHYHKVFGIWRANKKLYTTTLKNTALMYKMGVKMCAGTDIGAVVAFPGELADEILRLTRVGFSNIDAIRAATINAAELLGVSKEAGSVEPGKLANVALVEGNPLEDITALRKVRFVGKSGSWYRPFHYEILNAWQGHPRYYQPEE